MSLNSYRFRSAWWLDSTPGQVFDVLADLGGYPHWWREVREARQVAERAAELRCRSLLPYDLVFEARHNTEDRDAGLLRADLVGDLDGTASWSVRPGGPGARLVFDQEVVVRKALLRGLAPVARPVFRFNHALMMRSAERGLRTYLAGFLAGRRERVADQPI